MYWPGGSELTPTESCFESRRIDDHIGPAAVRWNHDTDAVCVPFLRRGPLDLADHCGFADIADIQNDYTLIAVGEIRAVSRLTRNSPA
jgi:hypothetical protein